MEKDVYRKLIQDYLDDTDIKLSDRQKDKLEETVWQYHIEKKMPAESLGMAGFPKEAYRQGYNLFQSGKFEDALCAFSVANMLDPTFYPALFGVAACYHHLKDYQSAIANYIRCSFSMPTDPLPSFHLHECFLQLGMTSMAIQSLRQTIHLAAIDPAYSNLAEVAKLEIARLEAYLKENPEQKEDVLFQLKFDSEEDKA